LARLAERLRLWDFFAALAERLRLRLLPAGERLRERLAGLRLRLAGLRDLRQGETDLNL